MKHIFKGIEPAKFAEWKGLANEDWQPTYGNMGSEMKGLVKSALMEEQGHICCYCERRLTDNDSHIEHFRPQSDSAVDPLDFANLLCSCQLRIEKGVPRHCGNLKDHWFDEELLVSPLDIGCESRFVYDGDGVIRASNDDLAASTTIEKLGLDIPKLNEMRAMAIEAFLDGALTQEEVKSFAAGYLKKNASGHLNEFWTTIRYLFGELAVV